ncbi:MAG: c(7)-type cytochrome triheme domain-containing protein [Gemmatimonadales bacterium]
MARYRNRWFVTGLVALVFGGAACRSALTAVLDLPPARPAAAPVASPGPVPAGPVTLGPVVSAVPADTGRPAIEGTLSPDSAMALLPRDRAGNLDWVTALRTGVIAPRPGPPGKVTPPSGFQFGFDFVFKGPDTTFDAAFPHSTHTEMIACQQCHPRVFPYRNPTITMADVLTGKYCGACHGKVAFNPATACERCHTRFTSLPPNRTKPVLLGDNQLTRFADDSGNARGIDPGALPAATFPHWVHRVRFQCKACHVEIFEAKAGANRVTMRRIAAGEACGRCHNGADAFAPSISNCQVCHRGSIAPKPSQ